MATHSVQPLAMSVIVRRVDELTFGLHAAIVFDHIDLEEARWRSRQSAKVRTGMLRRIAEPMPLRRLHCPSMCKRAAARTRSMVAALTCRTLVSAQ